jgi:hypothetical protein
MSLQFKRERVGYDDGYCYFTHNLAKNGSITWPKMGDFAGVATRSRLETDGKHIAQAGVLAKMEA